MLVRRQRLDVLALGAVVIAEQEQARALGQALALADRALELGHRERLLAEVVEHEPEHDARGGVGGVEHQGVAETLGGAGQPTPSVLLLVRLLPQYQTVSAPGSKIARPERVVHDCGWNHQGTCQRSENRSGCK